MDKRRRTKEEGQKKDKGINNDLQNITRKTKDQSTQTPIKTGGKLM